MVLEFSLTASQIGLIGLDFVKTPANFRDFCAAIPRCWSSSTGLSAIIACPFPLALSRLCVPMHPTAWKKCNQPLPRVTREANSYGNSCRRLTASELQKSTPFIRHVVPVRIRFNSRIYGYFFYDLRIFLRFLHVICAEYQAYIRAVGGIIWSCISPI